MSVFFAKLLANKHIQQIFVYLTFSLNSCCLDHLHPEKPQKKDNYGYDQQFTLKPDFVILNQSLKVPEARHSLNLFMF